MTPAAENPTTTMLDRLTHEYSLKEDLDASWAVRPLELVCERGRTMLVLDDPGAVPLRRLLGEPMALPGFLRLAESMTIAVRGLHERGLVHKDINPATVLVNAEAIRETLVDQGYDAAKIVVIRNGIVLPPGRSIGAEIAGQRLLAPRHLRGRYDGRER